MEHLQRAVDVIHVADDREAARVQDNRASEDPVIAAATMNLRDYRIGAAIFCLVRGARPAFALRPAPFLSRWECDLSLPDAGAPAQKSTE
jgi:hypothetical protein